MLEHSSWGIVERRRLKKIASLVRSGVVPEGVPKERVWEALKQTRPKNAVEMFGFLTAKLDKADGSGGFAERLVSVKSVTTAFVIRMVDALIDSAVTMSNFHQHKMGSGSTAEAANQTALVAAQSGAQAVGGATAATHGSTSGVYRTIGTITATYNSAVMEHGVFNASSAGGIMLDRSLVTSISVATDDVITWTYELTINSGG